MPDCNAWPSYESLRKYYTLKTHYVHSLGIKVSLLTCVCAQHSPPGTCPMVQDGRARGEGPLTIPPHRVGFSPRPPLTQRRDSRGANRRVGLLKTRRPICHGCNKRVQQYKLPQPSARIRVLKFCSVPRVALVLKAWYVGVRLRSQPRRPKRTLYQHVACVRTGGIAYHPCAVDNHKPYIHSLKVSLT